MTSGSSFEQDMDLLRQRMKAERQRSDRERLELLSQMQEAMREARRRQDDQESSMRRHQAFLSRARAEADIAKAHFEADMKRRQAFFEESAAHAARREAERTQHAEEQRRRSASSSSSHEYGLPGVASASPRVVATPQQELQFGAYETAFIAFEAAPSDGTVQYGLASCPWPPASCPVSGVRKGDSVDRRKQLLKLALLRWHPDKFEAAHSAKLSSGERAAIMEKVNAVLRRVQAERVAFADADDAGTPGTRPAHSYSAAAGASYVPPRTAASTTSSGSPSRMDRAAAAARVDRDLEEHRRTAAAAAARFMPQAQPRMPMSRATGPKIVRPSRAAFAAAADAAASAGVQIDPTIPAAAGPRTAKYAYEGRFQ